MKHRKTLSITVLSLGVARAVFRTKGMLGERLATHAPYGYLLDENKTLIVDEETAPVVQLFTNYVQRVTAPARLPGF